jgi:hypothetical protein
LHHVKAASFVSPRIVPSRADAEDVVAEFTPMEGVHYTALWKGMFPANSGAKQRFKIPEIVQNGRKLAGRMPVEQLRWAPAASP